MCSKIKVAERLYVPGDTLIIRNDKGSYYGHWGIGPNTVYNARLERLTSYWRDIAPYRGYILVDSFMDGNVLFKTDKEPTYIGIIYTAHYEFALITTNSISPILEVHHRMPFVLPDLDSAEHWIRTGAIEGYPKPELIRAA